MFFNRTGPSPADRKLECSRYEIQNSKNFFLIFSQRKITKISMRIWSFLVVYSCWSDAGKEKQSVNENDTAAKALTKGQVFLKDVLPPEEYKPFEKASKQEEMRDKIKVNC